MKMMIMGPPLVGKSTLATYMRVNQTIPVIDFDEEIFRLNHGTWPEHGSTLMQSLKKRIIEDILKRDSVIFMSFECKEAQLREAREKGFRIIQLETSYEVLTKRNEQRLLTDPSNDAFQFVQGNIDQQKEMNELGLVDKIINADQPTEKIAEVLLTMEM